jgi:4'-phosphopantetheinyl transferase
VWRAALNDSRISLASLESVLDVAERERADRLRTPEARRRFVAARARLRHILARYLDTDPVALRFAAGPNGKPALAGEHGGCLAFNLAHTGDLALYAVTRRASVGIDVERPRAGVATERIATRFFAPSESARLQGMPPRARRIHFARLWACKEAMVKARGESVWRSFGGFEVRLPPDAPAPRLVGGAGSDLDGWTIVPLEAGAAYAAALVVAGGPVAVACWQWTPQAAAARRPMRTGTCAAGAQAKRVNPARGE